MGIDWKIIKSVINYDKNSWLQKLKLPGIQRFFESIYYSYEWINKSYWKILDKFNWKDLGNNMVWISNFFEYQIICFIDLNNLSSKYYFVKDYNFFDIEIDLIKVNIFIYKDFNNKINYFTDYKWEEFSFEYNNNLNQFWWWKLNIKNNIFDSIILLKSVKFEEKNDEKIKLTKIKGNWYVDIADFFIFEDYFVKSEWFEQFYDFLSLFNNKNIKIDKNLDIKLDIIKWNDQYNPKIKINLSIFTNDILKSDLSDISKLLWAFYAESNCCYLIDNDHFKSYFIDYINDFTHLDFEWIDLNFKLPNNIFESDLKYEEIKLNILKFRYNLFILKDSLKSLNKQKIEGKNSYTKFLKNRVDITKNTLEIRVKNYEESFKKLLYKISELYKNKKQ